MPEGLVSDVNLTAQIIGAAIEVHKFFGGPGLLESAYEKALVAELRSRGIACERQVLCPVIYKGKQLDEPFRIDILVEGCVVVECKSATENNPLFAAQCLTYLKLKGLKTGLVINFGKKLLKDGIERVVN